MTKHPAPHPLRYWRFMNGMRLAETGARLGISESFLSLVERDKRSITPELAMRIEKKLGIPRAKLRPDLWGEA